MFLGLSVEEFVNLEEQLRQYAISDSTRVKVTFSDSQTFGVVQFVSCFKANCNKGCENQEVCMQITF